MTASGTILPIPKWYFVDNNGEPLGAGFLYTRRSLDKTQLKPVFQDPGLNISYVYTSTNIGPAIRIDANGTTGPIFWADDEPYYIFVTDMFGAQIWDMDGFGPDIAGGGGGGGGTTTIIDIDNLIQNGTFYRFGLQSTGSPSNPESISPVPAFITIAPGAHSSLSGVSTTTGGSAAPDICFIKNNTSATDTLSFGTFAPGGNEFNPADATPVNYLHYDSNAVAGETYKYVQFPITSGAQNLSNKAIKGTIWARWNSGAGSTLTLFFRQFFGSGPSATPDIISDPFVIDLITTDTGWHQYPITMTVPDAGGSVLGECGNDGLFFQVQYPLNAACSIDFVKPAIFIGTLAPTLDFTVNDHIESIVNDFRTGDVRMALNFFAPLGWLGLNDGTIGSPGSGATARANRDTFPLYALLWNNVSDTFAPVIGGRGASAVSDFVANKAITLTKMLGRVLGGTGAGAGLSPRSLGQIVGTENQSLSIANLAAHTHPLSAAGAAILPQGPNTGSGTLTFSPVNSNNITPINLALTGNTDSTGSGTAFSLMNPTSYVNIFIKL